MKYEKKVVFCQWEPFGEVKTMYFVRQKKHWWSRWKLIEEDGVPRLFTSEGISNFINIKEHGVPLLLSSEEISKFKNKTTMKKFKKLKALWNILTAPAFCYYTFSKKDAPFVEADMLHSVILTAARKLVEAEVINETRLNMIQDIIEDRSVVLHTVALSDKGLQVPTHFVSYDATDEDIALMKEDEFI